MAQRPQVPKPSEAGFTNDQANYLNELVRVRLQSHLASMKKSIDEEVDKIVDQLTAEIDELRTDVEKMRVQIAAKQSTPGAATTQGQLITQDAVKKTITEVVQNSSRAIQQAAVKIATEAAMAQINQHVIPQLLATQQLAQRTATQVRYQSDDHGDMINNYRIAAMVERETDGVDRSRRAIGDGSGRDTEIVPGAVRTFFSEEDIV